jgi:hypothetical protein
LKDSIDAENELDRRKASPMASTSATKQASMLIMDSTPSRNSRLRQAIQTMVIKPAKQNPTGFAALAVALFALLVVARMAQAPSTPPPTEARVDSMVSAAPLLFAADFRRRIIPGNIVSELSHGKSPRVNLLSNTEAGRAITSLLDTEAFQHDDSYIAMEGRILGISASPSSAFGIVFRYQDGENYYVFGVDGMRRFSFWKLQAGTWCEWRTAYNGGEHSEE